MAEINIMLFVACFLGCMRGKHQVLAQCFDVLEFVEQVKGSGNAMSFVEVIHIGFKAYFINQLGTTHTQQDKLRYFSSYISIVQTVTNGLRYIIVLRQVGA